MRDELRSVLLLRNSFSLSTLAIPLLSSPLSILTQSLKERFS